MRRTSRSTTSSSVTPEAGPLRDTQQAIGVGPDRLGEEGVTAFGRPARRVVRELDERAAADTRGDMQVRQQSEPVGPGVRGEPPIARQRDLRDRPRPEHPAGEHDVGLVDVERIGIERREGVLEGPSHLAAGDAHTR